MHEDHPLKPLSPYASAKCGADRLVWSYVATYDLPAVIDEGLIILAWLSVWRPAEMLAYEWLPLHRRRRLYERLSTVRVTAHTDVEAIAPGNGTHDGAP